MTDAAHNGNGNGNGLWKEFFATRERGFAWVARSLLLCISALAAVTLWLAKEQLTDLKMLITTNNTQLWTAVGGITSIANKNTNAIGQLSTTLTDHIADENRVEAELRRTQDDHETRIRTLEARP